MLANSSSTFFLAYVYLCVPSWRLGDELCICLYVFTDAILAPHELCSFTENAQAISYQGEDSIHAHTSTENRRCLAETMLDKNGAGLLVCGTSERRRLNRGCAQHRQHSAIVCVDVRHPESPMSMLSVLSQCSRDCLGVRLYS